MEAERQHRTTDEIVMQMIELAEKNYNCSQIIMILALQQEDKENPGKQMMKLGFTLNRGSYATVVLREFMKPQDLIEAGY